MCPVIIGKPTTLVNVQQAADLCGFQIDYLSRLCQRCTGESVGKWLRRQRLQIVAKKIVSDSTLTLTDIADEFHYADAFTLSKAFKRQFGMSPRRWRQTWSSEDK